MYTSHHCGDLFNQSLKFNEKIKKEKEKEQLVNVPSMPPEKMNVHQNIVIKSNIYKKV